VAKPFGLIAEGWTVEMLESAGYKIRRATYREDHVEKVDFWVWSTECEKWIPVQFTLDRKAAVSWKGIDALRRGIVISWLDSDELRGWATSHSEKVANKLAGQFWGQLERVLQISPNLSRQYAI